MDGILNYLVSWRARNPENKLFSTANSGAQLNRLLTINAALKASRKTRGRGGFGR